MPFFATGCLGISTRTLTGMAAWPRFLTNTMLASGGYPWTVGRVQDRKQYLAALDSARTDEQIAPFVEFIAQRIQWSVQQVL